MDLASQGTRLALLARTGLLRVVSPLERWYAGIRGLPPLPPLWLRRHVGAAGRRPYENAVAEGERHLREMLGAGAGVTAVLDLGCGCGAMVPFFRERLPDAGAYLGVDIHAPSVRWCRDRYAADARLSFGVLPAAWPAVLERRYDLVLAKSLFTHLLEAEASDYLSAIGGALEPGGRLVLTAFLFDAASPSPALPHAAAGGRVRLRRPSRPEAAVGYDRDHFLSLLERAGLQVLDARYWFWPGDHARLTTQDLLVCGRLSAAPARPVA